MYEPTSRTDKYLPAMTQLGTRKYIRWNDRNKTFKSVYIKDFTVHSIPLEGDPTGLTVTQAWIALEKAWLAFKAYKRADDVLMMEKYANVINIMKEKLGFPRLDFYF